MYSSNFNCSMVTMMRLKKMRITKQTLDTHRQSNQSVKANKTYKVITDIRLLYITAAEQTRFNTKAPIFLFYNTKTHTRSSDTNQKISLRFRAACTTRVDWKLYRKAPAQQPLAATKRSQIKHAHRRVAQKSAWLRFIIRFEICTNDHKRVSAKIFTCTW